MDNPCKLMCASPGEIPVEKGTVLDGTPCGVSGVCIAGTCIVSFLASTSLNFMHYILLKPMGCDGLLGSDKRMDKCGQCGSTEGVCLHVPCNIKKKKIDEQESGM